MAKAAHQAPSKLLQNYEGALKRVEAAEAVAFKNRTLLRNSTLTLMATHLGLTYAEADYTLEYDDLGSYFKDWTLRTEGTLEGVGKWSCTIFSFEALEEALEDASMDEAESPDLARGLFDEAVSRLHEGLVEAYKRADYDLYQILGMPGSDEDYTGGPVFGGKSPKPSDADPDSTF